MRFGWKRRASSDSCMVKRCSLHQSTQGFSDFSLKLLRMTGERIGVGHSGDERAEDRKADVPCDVGYGCSLSFLTHLPRRRCVPPASDRSGRGNRINARTRRPRDDRGHAVPRLFRRAGTLSSHLKWKSGRTSGRASRADDRPALQGAAQVVVPRPAGFAESYGEGAISGNVPSAATRSIIRKSA